MADQGKEIKKKAASSPKVSVTPRGELLEGRVPPHSKELEEAVLGAMLLEREKLSLVMDILTERHFYFPEHQAIFKSIFSLYSANSVVDLLTVNNDLRNKGDLTAAGGSYYLAQLTNKLASAANIEYYARILTQKFVQRELIRVCGEISTEAYDDSKDALTMLDDSEKALYAIKNESLKRSYSSIETLIGRVIDDLKERSDEENEGITGVPSGFLELDRFTAGFQPSDLVIMAARPGMGKTAMALSFLRNAVLPDRNGKERSALMFSLEMSDVQLVQRMISAEVEISGDLIKKGQLTDQEWKRLHSETQNLSQSNIFIDDTPQMSIFDLMAKCRRVHSQFGLHIVIVDYLQLLTHSDKNAGNREQEIAFISRSLKGLAKELNIPVIALAQLSREVEKRAVKKPQLSDLRESGSIEQDADIVLFLYRSGYYEKVGQGEETSRDQSLGPTVEGLTEIVVGKNRHGSVGEAKVKFVGQYSKFIDLSFEERAMMGINTGDDFGEEKVKQSRMNQPDINPFDDDNEDFRKFQGGDDDFSPQITED